MHLRKETKEGDGDRYRPRVINNKEERYFDIKEREIDLKETSKQKDKLKRKKYVGGVGSHSDYVMFLKASFFLSFFLSFSPEAFCLSNRIEEEAFRYRDEKAN